MPTNPSEFEFDTWVHRYRESDKETDGNRARDTEREPERERCRERDGFMWLSGSETSSRTVYESLRDE